MCPSHVLPCIGLHVTCAGIYIYLLCSIMGLSLVSLILCFSKVASHNTASLLPTEITAIRPSHLFPSSGPYSLLCLGLFARGTAAFTRGGWERRKEQFSLFLLGLQGSCMLQLQYFLLILFFFLFLPSQAHTP